MIFILACRKRFKMKAKIIVLFLSACLASTAGQADTSVCTGQFPGPNDPPLPPSLPNVFDVHVEANINNRNYTSEYHIWYDQVHNQVASHVGTGGTKSENLYRFDTNEFYHVDRVEGTCTVQPLSNSPQLFLFGTTSGDMVTMKTPNQFLRFNENGIGQKWINQTIVRGITCNLWRSCLYLNSMKATMVVDWYFSAPSWATSRFSSQIPVRAHVFGSSVMPNGQKRSFDHMYEFSDFNPNPDKNVNAYQTPAGVYCQRAKNTKPLPTPSSVFHFTSEIITTSSKTISSIKEWYDGDLNLVRYDYNPMNDPRFGSAPLTQVHDFSTGIAYIIDKSRGNCTTTPISNTNFDSEGTDSSHVRIRTSKEFFYLEEAYIYEGQRKVRGITSDVWIAQRNDWPTPDSAINSTWEWYFATSNFSANLPQNLTFGLPVRMVLDAGEGMRYVYNIYDYGEKRPMIWSYDISNCFSYTERRDFSFKLSGSFRELVYGNMELFRYAVLRAIVKAGTSNSLQLSPLRVYNIQIDYEDDSDIIVQFTLLDKAPQVGDVSNPRSENSLNIVANSISNAINSGQLTVHLQVPKMTNIVAKPYSLSPGRYHRQI